MVCHRRASVYHGHTLNDAWECEAPEDWPALLRELSEGDEGALPVRVLALAFRGHDGLDQLAAVQRWVQQEIAYVPDDPGPALTGWLSALSQRPGEVFRSPAETLRVGYGDCDDHARLVRALLRALGWDARYVVLQRGRLAHVVTAVPGTWHGADGDRIWVETTLPAELGEHPIVALGRLGRLDG
jgi:transglutaminase-like putative cysteine protease